MTLADKIAALREQLCGVLNAAADLRDTSPPGSPEKALCRTVARMADGALTRLDDALDDMGMPQQ